MNPASKKDPVALATTAAPPRHTLHPQSLTPAPLLRAHKLHLMLTQFAARGMSHSAATAAMLPLRFDPGFWQELQALQQSVMKRLQQQQQGWLDGMAALAQEYAQSRQANTLSKYVEQEYNLVAQYGALVSDQAAKLAGLMENIQVDYGYWMAQQQERQGVR